MSTFDPEAFLNDTVDAPLSTTITPVPVGEYVGTIEIKDMKNLVSRIKYEKDGAERELYILNVPWVLQGENAERVKAQLERERLVVEQRIILDIDEMTGKLDTGKEKNVGLGRLREALGQNGPGAWSFSQLQGQGPCVLSVKHEMDKKDPEIKYARVTKVAPLR